MTRRGGPAGSTTGRPGARHAGRRLAPILAAGLLVAPAHTLAAQPATAPGAELCCPGEEEAKKAFDRAADVLEKPAHAPFRNLRLDQARDDLCRASCCWPQPDPRPRSIAGFARVPYAPFLYLGLYYRESSEACSALESLNLSECQEEIATASEAFSSRELERFEERRNRARDWARSERPAKRKDFQEFLEGLDAYERRKWSDAARKMRQAIDRWDEDGDPARAQGRFPDPYLPRYYLGSVLFELGCFREAVDLIRCSRLSGCRLEGEERRVRERILVEGAERVEEGAEEPAACDEWRRLEAAECCRCVRCGP